MKAVVAAFNQEKALVGAFSVITNLRMELFQALMLMVVVVARFLHDVVTVVITDTGALSGLFDGPELNSENVKDKEAKVELSADDDDDDDDDDAAQVEFLTKLIDALSFSSGQTLAVKPGKIVSGQEADKTNEMLQVLANIIINKVTRPPTPAAARVMIGSLIV